MRVAKAGYNDTNKLTFENITVLGVPYPPTNTTVTSTSRDGTSTTTSTFIMDYDTEKKVQKPLAMVSV